MPRTPAKSKTRRCRLADQPRRQEARIYLGQVEAADAETAIKRAIEKYDIAAEHHEPDRGPADHASEPAMIVEGRTIRTIEEMQEFCKAAVAAPRRSLDRPPARPAGHARRRDHPCGRPQGLRRAGFTRRLNAALRPISRRPLSRPGAPPSADDFVVLSGSLEVGGFHRIATGPSEGRWSWGAGLGAAAANFVASGYATSPERVPDPHRPLVPPRCSHAPICASDRTRGRDRRAGSRRKRSSHRTDRRERRRC